jgi:hypothetical protein
MQGQANITPSFAADAASLFFSSSSAQPSGSQAKKSGFARYTTPSYVPVEQNGDAEAIAAQLLKDSELRDKIKRMEFQLQEQQMTIAQLKAESVRAAEAKRKDEEEAAIKQALDAQVASAALEAVIMSRQSEVEIELQDVAQEIYLTTRSVEVHEQLLEKASDDDRKYYMQLLSQKRAQLTALRRKDAMLNQKQNIILLAAGADDEELYSENGYALEDDGVGEEVQSPSLLHSIPEGFPALPPFGENYLGIAYQPCICMRSVERDSPQVERSCLCSRRQLCRKLTLVVRTALLPTG